MPFLSLLQSQEVRYSEGGSGAALVLPEHGTMLRFDSLQRCQTIEVFDISRVQLRYAQALLGGAAQGQAANLTRTYELFGPTYPGTFDAERGAWALRYPGLMFLFTIPARYAPMVEASALPLELPDGSAPLACRIVLSADAAAGPRPPLALRSSQPGTAAGTAPLAAVLNFGLLLPGKVGLCEARPLPFGSSPQDCWAVLGEPSAVSDKAPARSMAIHGGTDAAAAAAGSLYFMHWFSHGIDVVFDGTRHEAAKFVLHFNAPGSSEFGVYEFCVCQLWRRIQDMELGGLPLGESRTPWAELQLAVDPSAQPVPAAQGALACVGGSPFPPTFVHWLEEGVTVEVLRSGALASLTLWSSAS